MNYTPFGDPHVREYQKICGTSSIIWRHLDRSKHLFRPFLKIETALRQISPLTPLKRQLRLEQNTRSGPSLRDSDERGLLTCLWTEVDPYVFDSVE
jgi:hypothetical protein